MKASEILAEQGLESTVLRLMELSDFGMDAICARLSGNHRVVIVEETGAGSGIGDALASNLHDMIPDCCVHKINLGNQFVPHGSLNKLYELCGLDGPSIAAFTKEVLANEN